MEIRPFQTTKKLDINHCTSFSVHCGDFVVQGCHNFTANPISARFGRIGSNPNLRSLVDLTSSGLWLVIPVGYDEFDCRFGIDATFLVILGCFGFVPILVGRVKVRFGLSEIRNEPN